MPLATHSQDSPVHECPIEKNREIISWLQANMRQVESRIKTLERRLPLIERSTASLQSMLSTNRELLKQSRGIRKSHTPYSQSSDGPPSDTSDRPTSSKRLSGATETLDFEEQLHLMLLTGKLRISLANSTTTTSSTPSSIKKGKQPFTFPDYRTISPQSEESPLDGDTLQWPNNYEEPDLAFDPALGSSSSEPDLMDGTIWQDGVPFQLYNDTDRACEDGPARQRALSPSKIQERQTQTLGSMVQDDREIWMGNDENTFPESLDSETLFDFHYDPSDFT